MGRMSLDSILRLLNQRYQGASYDGVGFEGKICGVSILRAGEVSYGIFAKITEFFADSF